MSSSDESAEPKPRPILASQLDALVADVEEPAATAFLVGLSGHHAGKLFRIKEGESFLGRSSSALVTLDEKAVSQKHAQLVFHGGQCVLLDLGSTNGTYLNDVRVTQPVELHAGDVIRLGKSVLGFLTDAEDQEQHTRALARVPLTKIGPVGASNTAQRSATLSPAALVLAEPATENPLDNLLDKLALGARFLKSYWLAMVLGAAFGALAGASTIFTRPPLATAALVIALRHESDEGQQGGQRFVAQSASYFRHPHANFLNPELVRSTLQTLNLPIGPTVIPVVRSLKFETLGEGVYRAEYMHADAPQAERFLAAHLQNYLEEEITKSIKVQASEVALLRKQYQDNEAALRDTEAKLKTFKETHLAGLPENAAGQLGARAELQTRVVELQANLERYTQELAMHKKRHAEGDAIVATRVDRTQSHSSALASTRQKLAALRSRGLTDAHPEVQALLKEEQSLGSLEASAISAETTEVERRANREYAAQQARIGDLEVAVSSTKTELGLVSGRLGEINKITSMMPAVEAEFSELSRTLSASQNLHQHLYEQLKAKELKLEFDRASVAGRYEILEPLGVQPVAPATTAIKRAAAGTGAGLFLGALGGVMHLFLKYARGRKRGGAQPPLLS
jgi:hypothetical protein